MASSAALPLPLLPQERDADQHLLFGLQQRSLDEIKPYADNVILKVDRDEHVSPGGIILGVSKVEREKYLFATVLAVGPAKWTTIDSRGKIERVPVEFKPGDRVLINRSYARCTLNEENDRHPELIIVRAGQILPGVLE